jgi:hypothetical protein
MMISPEFFYDEFLKGKDEASIRKTIRGIKQKISRLKKRIESPNKHSELQIFPTDDTVIWCNRMYLDAAKQALIEVGGKYYLSKAEKTAMLFEASVFAICKLVLSIDGNETFTIRLDEQQLNFNIEHLIESKSQDFNNRERYICNKECFLEELKKLNIGEWHKSYNSKDIIEEKKWSLNIEFADGHEPFSSVGNCVFPYNFQEFHDLLNRKNFYIIYKDC